MGGLASHCHERLTNTKRKQEVWKKMEENGGRGPQVNGFSLFSRALASQFGPPKELPDFSPLSPIKTQHNHVLRY